MSSFREAGPESNIKFEEEVQKWYLEILKNFKKNDFNITPAEAIFLKQTIRDCVNEQDEIDEHYKKTKKEHMDNLTIPSETIERFFLHYYGISYDEYMRNIFLLNESEREKARKDFFKYVQEKLRKDRELI